MTTIAREFWMFFRQEGKWWLMPMLVVLGAVGAIVLLATLKPALAPFIYPLI